MYCNEKRQGKHRGFWLIDDKDRKQPFYFTLQNYYRKIKRSVAEFAKVNGRRPTDVELRKMAIKILRAKGTR